VSGLERARPGSNVPRPARADPTNRTGADSARQREQVSHRISAALRATNHAQHQALRRQASDDVLRCNTAAE